MKLGLNAPQLIRVLRKSVYHARWSRSASYLHPSTGVQTKTLSTYNNQLKRLYSTDNVTWLWKADKGAVGFNAGSKHGTRAAAVELTFNSQRHLDLEEFHQAFTYFIRIMPNMRTLIRPRGEEHWFCQPHDPKIDLEVLTDQENFREDCFDELAKGFQETDTTCFKVRLIKREPDAPCYVEGVKNKYPHQYDLMILHNHAMTDGNDMRHLYTCLHKLLDDIAGGRTLSDDAVGIYEENNEIEALLIPRRKELLQDQERFENVKKSLPSLGDVPTIIQAFPRPQVSTVTTKHVLRTINPDMLKGLLTKCSEKRVTFNSFCIAIANVATTELMKDAGFIQDSYKLTSLNFIDARRYMTVMKYLHGCHLLTLTCISYVYGNEKDSFWEYCQKQHHELQLYYAKDGRVLDQTVVNEILESNYPSFNYTDNPRPVSHDYSITSMGDLTHTMKGDGKYVQLTNIITFNKLHNFRNGLLQEIYTFRGRTIYTLTYATNYFSDKTINLLADKIFELFETFGK